MTSAPPPPAHLTDMGFLLFLAHQLVLRLCRKDRLL